MAKPGTLLSKLAVALVLLALSGATAFADNKENKDDKTYSSVIKYMKSNYKAKGQSALGFITLARFVIKVIKPAGVKNFKLSMLRDLQFTTARVDDDLGTFIRTNVHPSWEPMTQVVSRKENQYVYVYFQQEKEDAKFLIVAVQQKDAFVIQFKFSPDKLAKFLENPEILGISLTGDEEKKSNSAPPNVGDEEKKKEEGKPLEEGKKSNEVKPPISN
jgi:hypothetical protein